MWIILVMLAVAFLVGVLVCWMITWGRGAFSAACVAIAPYMPFVAATWTAVTYIVQSRLQISITLPMLGLQDLQPYQFAVVSGIVVWLVLWLVGAWLYHPQTTVQRARPSNYDHLRRQLTRLHQQINDVKSWHIPDPVFSRMQQQRIEQAKAQHNFIARQLNVAEEFEVNPHKLIDVHSNTSWVLSDGYSDLWRRLHHAEEALLEVAPPYDLLHAALHDEARLQGSKIDQREELLTKLRRAIKIVEPAAGQYLNKLPPEGPPLDQNKLAARTALREVRRSIDQFRDERWEGLLRLRNRTDVMIFVTGIVAYVLLCLALFGGALSYHIIAVSAFFLLGALVGVFNQLYQVAVAEQPNVEDYGLGASRLIHRLVLSGLAAVGGVLVVAMVFSVVDGGLLIPDTDVSALPVATSSATVTLEAEGTPPASTAASNGEAGATPLPAAATNASNSPSPVAPDDERNVVPTLDTVFNLAAYPFALIIAAIFGLTPGLFIQQLNQQSERYKQDLQSTESTERDAITA